LLTALAAGLVASACSSGDDEALTPTDGGAGAGNGGDTGVDLVDVTLPGRTGDADSLPEAESLTPGPPEASGGATTPTAGAAPPTTNSGPVQPTTTAAPTTAAPSTTVNPFNAPVALATNADVLHMATRLTFGVTPSLQVEIDGLGTAGFLEDQLARTGPDPLVEERLNEFQLLGMTRPETYQRLQDIGDNQLRRELTHMNVIRARYSNNQLYEMMVHLWMDHFNINLFGNGRTEHLQMTYQEQVIRPNAMTSFRQLLQGVIESPGMLTYLNNDESNANSDQGVNENLGRELLELHTLGIDEAGNQVYTEADVRQAALAISGWSMEGNRQEPNFSEFVFRDNFHLEGEVSLLNGAWTSAGTTGKATGDSLLNFLVTHPSTARYVAYKIARRFVADAPPASLLDSTAQVYLANDTQLVPVLRHVFSSPEFAAAGGQKLRRPFELMMATLRALDSEIPGDPDGRSSRRLGSRLEEQGNEPWAWAQPNGVPAAALDWLSTSGMLNRWNLAARLSRDAETMGDDGDSILTNFAILRPPAATGDELILNIGRQIGLGDVPDTIRASIAAAARIDPAGQAQGVNDEQLGDVVGLLFTHPLFQTR
jgi:uncharacterized protein (DUF1800 family)